MKTDIVENNHFQKMPFSDLQAQYRQPGRSWQANLRASLKTHFTYISLILLSCLAIGWLTAFYKQKTASSAEMIQWLEREISSLRDSKNQPKYIFRTLRSAYPGVPEHKTRYYTLLINDLSGEFNVSWTMIAATIWVESRFDPTLTSPKAAKGVMQLLENTAAGQAYETGIKYHTDKTVWDDVTNLFLGVRYLSKAVRKEGNYRNAAYYYLAGPGWRKTMAKGGKAGGYLRYYASRVLGEKEKLDVIYQGMDGDAENPRPFKPD